MPKFGREMHNVATATGLEMRSSDRTARVIDRPAECAARSKRTTPPRCGLWRARKYIRERFTDDTFGERVPGRSAFVESESMHSTPSLPMRAIAAKSAGLPSIGV